MIYFLFYPHHPFRSRRRKKLNKALERQARKLRAKGITVDVETLKAEYLAQHRLKSESDMDEDDHPIDVVGDDSDDDRDTSSVRDSIDDMPDSSDNVTNTATSVSSPKSTIRGNPFSIESLLYNHT